MLSQIHVSRLPVAAATDCTEKVRLWVKVI